LRSFDRMMPEELNRIVTDHLSNLLFCPTQTAVDNLRNEGITCGVHLVGDVMVDALEYNWNIAEQRSTIRKGLGIDVKDQSYLVMTVHRPSNTDNKENLTHILKAVGNAGKPVVFPVHPRTRKYLQMYGLLDNLPHNVILTDPLGYLDMLCLMTHAEKILTDSGGIQKESYILGIPCITLRENTEWVETLIGQWNILTGSNCEKIISAIRQKKPDKSFLSKPFGKGDTAQQICKILSSLEN
jgi:UDP-GlcNAc3NAcA epimerase